MTSKIANQYSGIVHDDDATESSSSVLEIAQTGRHDITGSGDLATSLSRTKKLTLAIVLVAAISLIWLIITIVYYAQSRSSSNVYQKGDYYPLTGQGTTGYSTFLAILLYKHKKSDAIFGHIPHIWVSNEEPFLLVDQITKGVGELEADKTFQIFM
jgi:hypothetical protein